LRDAADTLRLSARGYHRVLRVALTLADLDGADTNRSAASGGVLSYRAIADNMCSAARASTSYLCPQHLDSNIRKSLAETGCECCNRTTRAASSGELTANACHCSGPAREAA
jgi:hypothetical protein